MNKKYRTRLQFATLDSKARKKSVTHISDAWPEELTELMNFLSGKIKQFLPKDTTEDLRKQILLAHLKNSPTPQEFVVMQLIVMTFCFLMVFLWMLLHGPIRMLSLTLFSAGAAWLGYKLPVLYLKDRIRQRARAISRELPSMLDLLKIIVEAGLDLDSAFHKITETSQGVVSDEIKIMLHEIRLGKSRAEAMEDLGKRVPSAELNSLVSTLLQADRMGISIGNVLEVQSRDLRTKTSQALREKAAKLPVMMLFPLVFLIFPTIFIILLAPAAISILQIVSK
jgi:tight adherence protein C